MEIGATYFEWTVISYSHKHKNGSHFYLCQCSCGDIKPVCGNRILRGDSKRCYKCSRPKKGMNKIHGLRHHPLYKVWRGIKTRCLCQTDQHWDDYGGRGIKICDRWKDSVQNFYDDMHEGYQKGLHIGRINNDGDYEPSNCRWETPLVNANNKRTNVYVTHDGRTHTPAEWARELFKKANTIQARIRRGKKDSDALFW
jgi:hypothetical protein